MAKLKFDWKLLKNRSELGRKLMLERLVKQNQKQQLVAYLLWFLLGVFGAHRMYLGQWRKAFILIGFYLFMFVASSLLRWSGLESHLYANLSLVVQISAIGVSLYEGGRLYFFVKQWNAELRQEIETQMAFV